jgi:hypothetical protein
MLFLDQLRKELMADRSQQDKNSESNKDGLAVYSSDSF